MKENWKDIRGFERHYQVSDKGRVRSKNRWVKAGPGGYRFIRSQIILGCCNEFGYKQLILRGNGIVVCVKVHRLVASAFKPNKRNLPEVNHINGRKLDNRATNLEWCSISYNRKHAYALGLNHGRKRLKY